MDSNLNFAISYCKQTAFRFWNKLPYEDRTVLSKEDFQQDLLTHFWLKRNLYNPRKEFKPWARTVIYNKALTILTTIWDSKIQHKKSFLSFSDYCTVTVYTNDDQIPETILVSESTPETILLQLEQEQLDMEGINITVKRVEELCERFSLPFFADDVKDSLVSVLKYTLIDITQEEFDALPEELRTELGLLGEAEQADKLSITAEKVGKIARARTQKKEKQLNEGKSKREATSGPGRGRRNEDGPVHHIRVAFNEGNGIITCAEMIKHMNMMGIPFSEATVRTQIGRLRKAYGISSEGPGRGGNIKSGIVHKIKELFNSGIQTVPEIMRALSELKIEFSPSTVRTQVGLLRKEAGLGKEARIIEVPDDAEETVEEVSIS